MADKDDTTPDDQNQDDQTDDNTDDDQTDDDPVAALAEELDAAKKEIRSLRGKVAAAKRVSNAAKADNKDGAKKDDDTGPSEKELELQVKLDEATQRTRSLMAESLAAKLNFRDSDVAVRLLDWDLIEDPDDRTQVSDALKELRKERPYLASDDDDDTGAGRRSRVQRKVSMNDMMRASLGRGPSRS